MGSGKTTLARRLAGRMGKEFFDSDKSIEELTGRSGREIAESDGVEALHRREREVLLRALTDERPAVIAAAASVIEDPEARKAMEQTFCIWVDADPPILAERAGQGKHRRNVGSSEHLEGRDPLFRRAADLIVDTGALSEEGTVEMVLAAIEGRRDEP
jgi:shikimate kinase